MAEPTPMWWGTTSTSVQTEGIAPAADWFRWQRSGRLPDSADGNGFATNHAEDAVELAALGTSHVRLTLEWARVEPVAGKTDSDALDHYDDVVNACTRAGLGVVATLQSGTLPGWFSEDEGGFADEISVEKRWAAHVDRMAERYGDRVVAWVPIDDPVGWALRGFGLGTRPPGRRSTTAMLDAAAGALLASVRAARLLGSGGPPVIASFGVPTVFEIGPESALQARRWRQLLLHSWVGLIDQGELVLPDRPPVLVDDAAGIFDRVGLVHDHPIGVDRHGNLHPYPVTGRRTDAGFTPIAAELGELLSEVHSLLPAQELVITGHGLPTSDDEWREEHLKAAVATIADARADGLPVVGYFHDTGIDGYEGPLGFTTTRGLLDRDRTMRDSALWFQAHLAHRDRV